jgi:hypothetical protein
MAHNNTRKSWFVPHEPGQLHLLALADRRGYRGGVLDGGMVVMDGDQIRTVVSVVAVFAATWTGPIKGRWDVGAYFMALAAWAYG